MMAEAMDPRLAVLLRAGGLRRSKTAHRWYFPLPGVAEPLLPGDPAIRVLGVELSYTKGGVYAGRPRGYVLSLMPMTLSASTYGISESFTLFDPHGAKFLLVETARFSEKTFGVIRDALDGHAATLAGAWMSSREDLRTTVAAVKQLVAA